MNSQHLPPLHPDRIRDVLGALYAVQSDVGADEKFAHETCIAALKLVQRTYAAVGFTSDVAAVGVKFRELLETAGRAVKR